MSDRVDEVLDGMVRDGVISHYERRNTRQMAVIRDGRQTVLSIRILTQLSLQGEATAREWVVAEIERLESGDAM
jgi:hypothetical protein